MSQDVSPILSETEIIDNNEECVICYNEINDDKIQCSTCSHTVCTACYVQLQRLRCPMCRMSYLPEHPILGDGGGESQLSVLMLELLLLTEQKRILERCRDIWKLHLLYLRTQVGLGNIDVMIGMGEMDILIARTMASLRQVNSSIHSICREILFSGSTRLEVLRELLPSEEQSESD